MQCVHESLVDGTVVHVDGSILKADACKDTLKVKLYVRGSEIYEQLERQLPVEPSEAQSVVEAATDSPSVLAMNPSPEPPAGTKVSTTDGDARLTCKNGQSILGYKDHRVVDDRCGIITATVTDRGRRRQVPQIAVQL